MATLLTNSGKAVVTNRIKGSGTEPSYVAVGTGAGTTAATDTTLFTETSRVAGTSTQQTTTVTNDTYQVVGTYTAGGSTTITNAGTFDAASSGNLFVKGDFTGVALNTGDSLQLTIKVAFA